MAYLKYYAVERERHKDAKAQTSFSMCVEMALTLFRHFKVPYIEIISYENSKGWSWYKEATWSFGIFPPNTKINPPYIKLNTKMQDALTIAHEVAHYIDDLDYQEHKKHDKNAIRGRWHSQNHKNYTDEGLSVLRKNPKFSHLFNIKKEKHVSNKSK